jgi:hypothetical protein
MKHCKALALLLLLVPGIAWGQAVSSYQGGRPLKKKFTASVDQLDEFIDRFNHKDPMFLDAFPDRPKRPQSAERAFLVKTLLNPKSKLDATVTKGFIKEVINPAKPLFLDFGDRDWYASLACRLMLDGKPVQGKLILKFELDTNGVTAWRIFSASGAWLDAEQDHLAADGKHRRRGLNPASHGNGFIALHRAFLSPESFADNLADSASHNAKMVGKLVASNRLKLDRVTSVNYHFLQVEGYVFTVSDITAPEGEPSGFLISRLVKANGEAKRRYRKSILHLEG